MNPLPAPDLRSNIATWAIPDWAMPSIGTMMLRVLNPEPYDIQFNGQSLETVYFDTPNFDLRKARVKKDQYLTLRIRCYDNPGMPEVYALSAKTESAKFRVEIPNDEAEKHISQGFTDLNGHLASLLPTDMLARLISLTDGSPLIPIVKVCFYRYAAEDPVSRFTLDIGIRTDTGKSITTNVLELKSTNQAMANVVPMSFRRMKMSKFLWATCL